jgi:large subunit ribosomal protein L30
MKIKLIKSISGRLEKQIKTAHSLGLRKIGDETEQPDNAATKGKIAVILHLIKVSD